MDRGRNRGWRTRFLSALPLVFLLSSLAPARAQSKASSGVARTAQFVLLIDDSKSMRETDPDRLSIFAVRSLLSMLDDRDEVSIVRLNAARDGAPAPPIEPLRKNRSAMESLLVGLSSYSGDNTPCRSALRQVGQLLDAAYRPDVAQVVMLLTDGECTPARDEQPEVASFLSGLRSQADEQFQFYLLRFRGQKASPGLARLAQQTGGGEIEVAGGDPTAILQTFAKAISRSQGYESYLLAPGKTGLAAHRGAERVRLLAVAPGRGEQLRFAIRDARGAPPRTSGTPRSGIHQFGTGRPYRFTALDYIPRSEPVTVAVEGAGEGWKVVALPEYRLEVRMSFTRGSCESGGPPSPAAVETGTTVCALTELVNAQGEVVGGDVAGDLSAMVQMRRPDVPGSAMTELPANPLPGGEARFGLTRSNLAQGEYSLRPLVQLHLDESEKTLRGIEVLLSASSVNITPQPARLDLGVLKPGSQPANSLRLEGNFPQVQGHLEMRDRADLPSCITAELNGGDEGKPQPILPNNPLSLKLRIAPYCGPRSFQRDYDTSVRFVFDTAPGSRPLPAVEVPLKFTLDYQISVPPELQVKVRAGEAVDIPLPVRGNFEKDLKLRAVLESPDEAEAWPEDRKDLALGFAGSRKKNLLRDEGETLRQHELTVGPNADPLRLRAVPGSCCAGGSYRTQLGLTPTGGQKLPPGAPKPEPIVVPVRIEVEPAGAWACYGPRVLLGAAALLLILLLLYLANMIRHSAFLKPETLATRLKPLVWTELGDTVEQKSSKGEVLRMVRKELSPLKRGLTWLKSNPLRFGLPGGSYRETVELFLHPHRDLARSQIALVPVRNLQEQLGKEPEGHVGRLFASALGGTTFFAVPDKAGRINRMVWQDGAVTEGEAAAPKMVKLHKAKLLRSTDFQNDYQQDEPAGWQVG